MLAIQPSRNRLTDFYKFGKSFDTVQAKTQTASVFTCVFFPQFLRERSFSWFNMGAMSTAC